MVTGLCPAVDRVGRRCRRWDLPAAHLDGHHQHGHDTWPVAPARLDVDLFAGPGGLDEGRRLAGHDDVPLLAIEWEANAARTAQLAGHQRVRADVATFPCAHLRGRVRLLVGAPPCPTFSAAGKGAGRVALDLFVWGVGRMLVGDDVRAEVRERHRALLIAALEVPVGVVHPKALDRIDGEVRDAVLVLEPARWVHATDPEAVVLEQVPAVLPIWQALARELRARGWSAWAGILNAADYGVPQTRRRAILVASRVRKVAPPPATHAERPAEDLFGGQLLPWVSMADALGWTAAGTDEPARTVAGNRAPRWLYEDRDGTHGRVVLARDRGVGTIDRHGDRPGRSVDEPAPTITAGGGRTGPPLSWELRVGRNANATRRPADQPASTLFFGHHMNDVAWVVRTGQNSRQAGGETELYERDIDRSAPTVTSQTRSWTVDRPATTIAGDPRVWPPGHRVNGDDRRRLGTDEADERYSDRAGTDAVRITVAEAATLQGFRPDYPWQGTRTRQFEQIGNAVPPPLSAACTTAALGPAPDLTDAATSAAPARTEAAP